MSEDADIQGAAAGALVTAGGTVCQLKINFPKVNRDDGAKRMVPASSSARWSAASSWLAASKLFSDGSKTAETTLPAASTSACTTLGATTSLYGSDGKLISLSSRRCASSPSICSVEFCARAGSI